MLIEDAIATLSEKADAEKAAQMRKYHKTQRPVLGIVNPSIDAITKEWRTDLALDERLTLARELWDSGIFEGRIAAAKLLAQARIRPDDSGAWDIIKEWVPQICGLAISDHVGGAGAKRLVWDNSRIDQLEEWVTSDHLWARHSVMAMTLPWTKINNPKAADLEIRERVLGWMETLAEDHRWIIQKTIGTWLCDLSRHDPERTKAFVADHGVKLKPLAIKEALRRLPK
jgi:3-methyladenine DNA glycosylase AlkD